MGSSANNVVELYEADPAGGFTLSTTLSPNSPNVLGFGQSVAVDGDRIVVGAPGATNNAEEWVYIFDWDGTQWLRDSIEASLTVATSDANFGQNVELSGNFLAVEASEDVVGTTGFSNLLGSVLIYENVGGVWTFAYYADKDLNVFNGTFVQHAALSVTENHVVYSPIERNAVHIYKQGAVWADSVLNITTITTDGNPTFPALSPSQQPFYSAAFKGDTLFGNVVFSNSWGYMDINETPHTFTMSADTFFSIFAAMYVDVNDSYVAALDTGFSGVKFYVGDPTSPDTVAAYVEDAGTNLNPGSKLKLSSANEVVIMDAQGFVALPFTPIHVYAAEEDIFSVAGKLFKDDNNNGVYDATDTPYPNATVQLQQDTLVYITKTDLSGNYIQLLDSGDVTVTVPSNSGVNTNLLSVDPATV